MTNELAGVPGASVQLWLRINQGGQDRYEVRDVSGEETTTFCRDLPAENVQEMALVIANSTHADRIHKLTGNVNVKGRPACSKWDGTTKTTIEQDGLTQVYLANYTFEPQWTTPLDGGGTESYLMAQGSVRHARELEHLRSLRDRRMHLLGRHELARRRRRPPGAARPARRRPGQPRDHLRLRLRPPLQVDDGPAHHCPDGYSGPVYFQLGIGFMSQPHPWDPTDQSIIGSETQDYPGVTIKREWTLNRNAIAP